MKLKNITIDGMHKVQHKSYDLKDITYFIGKNGAGKSTILQAIQLAILGYIPGYSKTNESIIKHASGNILSVSATLFDDSGEYVITRSWMKSGSSTKSALTTDPEGFDITRAVNELELPIFNFNDFRNMTSNKLKEWFIEFLPDSPIDIDWSKELTECLEDRKILSDELLNKVLDYVNESEYKGVDLIKGVNNYLKDSQSFNKKQLTRLQGTITSLVYYDDCEDADEDSLFERSNKLMQMRDALVRWYAQKSSNDANVEALKRFEESSSLSSESYLSDPKVKELDKKLIDAKASAAEFKELLDELSTKRTSLNFELSKVNSISSSACPYTNAKCASIEALIESNKTKSEELKKSLQELEESMKEYKSKYDDECTNIRSIEVAMDQLNRAYSQLELLRSSVADIGECPYPDQSVESIDIEYADIQDKLRKVAANNQYNKLMDSVTAEKFEIENTLEVLKLWIKKTDANGLQTYAMGDKFTDLAASVDKYLKVAFDDSISCKFNSTGKSNSFSFGLIRDGKYIEFDLLSSGEKCLYTLALMMCIISLGSDELNLLIVDDLLDHLDDDNAFKMFEFLKSVDDIQVILAGVKDCNNKFKKEIVVEV